jgi:hypothetical protein
MAFTLKTEAAYSSETLIKTYQTIWCPIPEECTLPYISSIMNGIITIWLYWMLW